MELVMRGYFSDVIVKARQELQNLIYKLKKMKKRCQNKKYNKDILEKER